MILILLLDTCLSSWHLHLVLKVDIVPWLIIFDDLWFNTHSNIAKVAVLFKGASLELRGS